MQRGKENGRDIASSLPTTSGIQRKKNVQCESKSTYRHSAKVSETGTLPRPQKKPLSIFDHPHRQPSGRAPESPPEQSDANLQDRGSSSQCAKIFNSHRVGCIFFGIISLVLNIIFTTVFVLRWRSTYTSASSDAPNLAIIGCAATTIFSISSFCLIVGSVVRLRNLLWIPMILTLLQFIPAAMFVFVFAEINHAKTWVSVTTSCVLGIVVLALSFYQLLQVVSLYVDLGPEHGHGRSRRFESAN